MSSPLTIVFKGVEWDEHLVKVIETKFSDLIHLCDRIINCKVTVTKLEFSQPGLNEYKASIIVLVPGMEILGFSQDKHIEGNAYISIFEAFDFLERQIHFYSFRFADKAHKHQPAMDEFPESLTGIKR